MCHSAATPEDDRSPRVTTTLSVELDRSSPVPLYFQVAQVFEKAILDGQLKPGDRFENELALASRLNLSRPTTRRAIQELVDKGLLVRKRGWAPRLSRLRCTVRWS